MDFICIQNDTLPKIIYIYIYIGLVRIPLQRTMKNLMRKSEKLVFGTCYLEMCFDPCQRVIIRDLLPSSSSTMGEGMANPTQVLSPPLWRQEVSPKKDSLILMGTNNLNSQKGPKTWVIHHHLCQRCGSRGRLTTWRWTLGLLGESKTISEQHTVPFKHRKEKEKRFTTL